MILLQIALADNKRRAREILRRENESKNRRIIF